MQKLEEKIGYTFKAPQLLQQALTHSSITSDIHQNYERLEFLGDRILGVTVADMLCRTFANEPEGNLSQRFVCLVCKETVAEIVRALGVDKYIIARDMNVSCSENVLCDIAEASIAAIYLDSGDITQAQAFVQRCWTPFIDRKSRPHKDFKTRLQEIVCHLGLEQPKYKMLKKTGSEHEPKFQVLADVGQGKTATGCGRNVKTAEQNAAQALLAALGVEDDA